jgi:hypothetical protein
MERGDTPMPAPARVTAEARNAFFQGTGERSLRLPARCISQRF